MRRHNSCREIPGRPLSRNLRRPCISVFRSHQRLPPGHGIAQRRVPRLAIGVKLHRHGIGSQFIEPNLYRKRVLPASVAALNNPKRTQASVLPPGAAMPADPRQTCLYLSPAPDRPAPAADNAAPCTPRTVRLAENCGVRRAMLSRIAPPRPTESRLVRAS